MYFLNSQITLWITSYQSNIWTPEKIEKKIRNKAAKKSWCKKKYKGVCFSIAFLCSILELSTENIKKKFEQNCFENVVWEFWKFINLALNVFKTANFTLAYTGARFQ